MNSGISANTISLMLLWNDIFMVLPTLYKCIYRRYNNRANTFYLFTFYPVENVKRVLKIMCKVIINGDI